MKNNKTILRQSKQLLNNGKKRAHNVLKSLTQEKL